jgi:hypothetical protein
LNKAENTHNSRFTSLIRIVLTIFFGLFAQVAIAQTPDISLNLRADKNIFIVGDKIVLSYQLEYPGQFKLVEPKMLDSLKSWGLEYNTTDTVENIEKDGRFIKNFNFQMSGFDSLDIKIKKLEFLFVKGADTLRKYTAPIDIKIRPIEVDTTKEISDVKPPERIPWGWLEYSILFGGLLLVALLSYLIYRRFKKKPLEEKIVEEPVKILSNFEIAFQRLEEIDQRGLIDENRFKEFYSEVSDTIRWYFEVEYHFPSLELTTRETLDKLRSVAKSENLISEVDDFLTRADMVKFAKYIPSEIESKSYIAGAVEVLKSCEKLRFGSTNNV